MVFFAEEVDNVTFGVQGSNVNETMQVSSTTDDVYMRLYTNNYTEVENLYTGAVIGSSNYDKSGASNANLYFGQILSDENASTVTRTMTISDHKVEIEGELSVYGHILPASNIGFDLGSSTHKFRDLYLAGNTIHLGEATIEETADGSITFVNKSGLREIDLDIITTTNASGVINLNAKSLSNLQMVKAANMDAASFKTDALSTSNPAGMNISGITLSNVGALDTPIITNSAGPNINVSGKSLSNINTVQTTTLTGLDGKINLAGDTLSNIGAVKMNANSTIFTDQVTSSSGAGINFLGTDLVNIRDLVVTGDIRARGEFFVTNTTTCNTSQFRIDNDGTGPALVANQQGMEDIIQVQDDGNTVFFIKDGGQAAFGSFGEAIDTGIPAAQVYIRNVTECNTTGLYVEQMNSNEDVLILQGWNASTDTKVIVDGFGNVAIGADTAEAKLFVAGTDADQPALLVKTNTNEPALSVATDTGYVGIGVTDASAVLEINGTNTTDPLVILKTDAVVDIMTVNADGSIGMGTAPVAGTTLTVAGTVRIENLIIGSADGSSLLTAYGMEAPDGRDFLLFGDNHLSNVTDVYADRIALEGRGTAAAPVFTFRPDQNTGLFSPDEDKLAITTAGVERMYVSEIGNVGIGTTIAEVRLAIHSTDAMLVPAGSTAERPASAKAGYVRYNSSLQTFEGFGPGNEWGSLGGVKSTDQQTYITAEAAPGVNDDIIRFYNNGVESARFDEVGHLGIGTTVAPVSLTIEGTDAVMLPAGSSALRPSAPRQGYVRYNTETLQFEGFGAGDAWGSLGGVKSVDQKTYISAEASAGVSDDTLRFVADNQMLMTLSVDNGYSNMSFYGDAIMTGTATIAEMTLNARTLCNVATLHTEAITSTAAAIDFSSKALSNVDRVITSRLTGPTAAGIDAEATTLSNLNILEVAHITTAAAGGLIDVSGKSLSNVSIMEVQTIHNAANPNINVSANSLSNITTVATANVVTTVLTSTGDNINVDTKSLSNITTVQTANLTSATNAINVSAKSLSNVGDIWMKQGETVYTDVISATSGASGTIGFNNNNLTNINDLTIGGKFTVIGEFTVMETTTSNTTQFEINNEGTGPALIVNQHGANDIMKVMDDTKVVMMIKDGGNMAIGDFGTEELPDPMPDAQLYVYNNATDNQPALFVKQDFATQHTMVLSGSGPGGSNVTFSSYGKLGFGNDAPNARIHAVHEDSVTQFMKYESIDDVNAFVVGADGRVGVKADPMSGTNVNNAVTITGTTQSDSFVAKTDVRTNKLTTDTGDVIDVSAKTLSNVNILRVVTVTTEADAIDFNNKALSNVNTVLANKLVLTDKLLAPTVYANTILPKDGDTITFNAKGLSNIGFVDTPKITNTLGQNIDLDDRNLSNVKSLQTSLLTSATDHIGFSAKTLCNVNILDVVTIKNLTTSVVDFAANTLSNVGALRTPVITSSVGLGHIDMTDMTLSNVGSLDVPRIENKDNAMIDFVSNTLSNVLAVDAVTLVTSVLTTKVAGGLINVDFKTLSNVNVLETQTITNASADHISLDSKALSNVGDVRLLANSKLEVNTMTTTDGRPNIDVSTRTLSNITTVETQNAVMNKLTTFAAGGLIDVDAKTLSNVSVLELATLTTVAAGGLINVDAKSLSNVTTLEVANLTSATAAINVSAKSLSNVSDLWMVADKTIFTDRLSSVAGAGPSNAISFSGNDLNAIHDLTITGKLTVAGDFTVMETTTSNTNQMMINNDGTGPALIVNQQGANDILKVTDDSDVVMFVKDGGNMGVGNFGTEAIPTGTPDARMYIYNTVDSQPAMYIHQDVAAEDTLVLVGSSDGGSNVTFSGEGKLGLGVAAPAARIDAVHGDDTTQFIHYASQSMTDAFVVGADGRVGVMASPMAAANLLNTVTVSGITQTDTLVAKTAVKTNMLTTDSGLIIDVDAKTLSNVNTMEVMTVTTTAANNTISFAGKSLSNIDKLYVSTLNAGTQQLDSITVDTILTNNAAGINMSGITLSNLGAIDTEVITNTRGNSINLTGTSLSNVGYVETSTITAQTQNINMTDKTLSNVNTLDVKILTNSAGDFINVDNITLSNVAALETSVITAQTQNINFTAKTLSNISVIEIATMTTTAAGGIINVDAKTLSNVDTLDVARITSQTANIDVSGITLSNVASLSTSLLTADTAHIGVDGKTLCNVLAIDVQSLTNFTGSQINMTNMSLSNVSLLQTVAITSMGADAIDVSNKSLSNLSSVYINGGGALVTDKITSVGASGTGVSFENNNVYGINNLTVDGDIRVKGEFFVMATTTCNTNQFEIDNDGTGPALIVNQQGANDIMNVTDDGTTVFYVKDGGYAGFGEYASGIPTSAPEARVVIENPAAAADTALLVRQQEATEAALQVFVGADAVSKLTVDARGTIAPVMVTDVIDSIVSGGVIDASATTFSNMDAISVAMITHTSGVIDMDNMTLSNMGDMQTSNLLVDTIGPLSGSRIDFSNTTLSNVGMLRTNDIASATPLGDISFNYSRILDVDTIIVRSNVTVMMTGTNTFTNLPTDVVRMNPSTNKIFNTDIPAEVVRVDSSTYAINPAMLPSVDTFRKTLMHTKDRVGIGLKNPQQKLHVHGNQVITSGRLGLGITEPRAILDIVDNNGASTMVRIEQEGSSDILDVRGAAGAPVLFAAASRSIGIHTSAPSSLFALDVNGKVNAATGLRTPVIESATGDIDCTLVNLNNILSADIQNLVVTGTITIPQNSLVVDGSCISMSNFATDLILTSVDTTAFDQTINFNSVKLGNINTVNTTNLRTSAITSPATTITCGAAFHVQGFDSTLLGPDVLDAIYGNQIDAEIGLRVDKNILAPSFLSISDRRIKTNVVASASAEDLDLLMKIPVTRYNFIDGDGRTLHGFIAQEVEEHAPFAVRTTTGVVPNIMRTPSAIHTNGMVVELVNHGIVIQNKKPVMIKVLIDGNELMTKVTEVLSPNSFRVCDPLVGETVFIYGSVVPDFKLLDSDRLVPLVFNAVKELHVQHVALQQTLATVLARLDKLEAARA